MIFHYGFSDGSGDWYVAIDTNKCKRMVDGLSWQE
jgi:hypothetical protein